MSWLIALQSVPLKIWLAVGGLLLIVGIFVYQSHYRAVAEREVEKLKREVQQVQDKNEGLKILVNTANLAIEIQKEKEKANVQANVSKNANANYANTRVLDSNTYSNSFTEAKRRYCAEFPSDSACS